MAQRDPFVTKPLTKYVYAGHNVTLNCGVWNDDFTVQWRTPRGLVADNLQGVYPTYRSYYDLHVPSANHFLLVLLRAGSSDAGRYQCSTFDDTGMSAHAYADIAVLSKQFGIFLILKCVWGDAVPGTGRSPAFRVRFRVNLNTIFEEK